MISGFCFFAANDVDSVFIRQKSTNQEFWQAKAGDLSVSGNNVNGPALVRPVPAHDLQVVSISAGARLYLYLT